MPFQSVPLAAKAVISYLCSGRTIVNVVNWRKPGGYDEAAIEALALIIDAAVGEFIRPVMVDDHSYTGTSVRGIENEFDYTADASIEAGLGGINATTTSNQVSKVITVLTGLTGRSARGRIYTPPVPSTWRATGILLDSTSANLLLDAWVDVSDEVYTSTGWELAVVQRYSNGTLLSEGVARTAVSLALKDLRMDTQRRRLG